MSRIRDILVVMDILIVKCPGDNIDGHCRGPAHCPPSVNMDPREAPAPAYLGIISYPSKYGTVINIGMVFVW